jgi:hypothetical protein
LALIKGCRPNFISGPSDRIGGVENRTAIVSGAKLGFGPQCLPVQKIAGGNQVAHRIASFHRAQLAVRRGLSVRPGRMVNQ